MKRILAGFAMAIFVVSTTHNIMASACTAVRAHDWNDMGCNQSYTGAGGPPQGGCPPCNGMPRWGVSEPYINLFAKDTPLSYRLSSGKDMEFTFYYRQRTKLPDADEVSGYPANPPTVGSDIYPGWGTGSTCGTNAFWGNNWTMSVTVWDQRWETNWSDHVSPGYYIPPGVYYPTQQGYLPFTQGYQVLVWGPEGGLNYFNVPAGYQNTIDPQSQVRVTSVTSGQNYPAVYTKISPSTYINMPTAGANGIYWGDSGVGIKLVYPDGSQEIFGLSAYPIWDAYGLSLRSSAGTSTERLLLTQRIDPQGRIAKLGYEQVYTQFQYVYRLKYVVDSDLRTNQFSYATTNSLQVTQISDPYARNVQIRYDASGYLTNITDAAGLGSSFKYLSTLITNLIYGPTSSNTTVLVGSNVVGVSSGWLSSMTTPYGTNSFNYFEAQDTSVVDGVQKRAICISEPAGARQLYYFIHKGSDSGGNPLFATTDSAPSVSGQLFDDGTSGTNHVALNYRNSVHWDRRQYANLSYPAQSYLPTDLPDALANLTTNDFNKGRVKNWLWQGDNISISESLGSERDPSPDASGNIPGLRLWYGYPGKTSPEVVGTQPQISCLARLLPDGTSQYTTYNYYSITTSVGNPAGAGLVSNTVSTYTKPDGSVGTLTNWFSYTVNSSDSISDLTSVSNSAGQYVRYGFNGSHQILAATNALNQVTTLSWDSSTFNLTGVQLPAGKNIGLNYNSPAFPPTTTSSMLQQVIVLPEGRTNTISSYSVGLPATVTDERGVTVNNTWDGLNRLTGTSFPDGSSISNIYSRLDLVAAKDRLGNWTQYVYDGLQHLTFVTNANNAVTSYTWCGCGSLYSMVDALNGTNTYNYDNQGNLTSVYFPDQSSLTYQFDLAGRMTNAFDGIGRNVCVSYNNQDLPTAITSANGLVRQTVYDALNRPLSVTDANGITTTNQYDAINQLLKQTWPDGISENYGYNAAGLIADTNRNGKVTLYGRDAAGRLTAVTNANQEVTLYTYDAINNVTDLQDGNANHTTWKYNEYGWLTNKADSLHSTAFRYAYNANGWVTNRWTPEKGNTGYAYDNVGNLTNLVYPQQTISYAYNALNRLTKMVDGVGTTTFGYTSASRLQSESVPWSIDNIAYAYLQGLRTNLTLTQPSGTWSQTYGYDAGWRMTNVVSPAGTFGYGFSFNPASSLVSSISLANGGSITNRYDSLGRLLSTKLLNSSRAVLDSEAYTYDPASYRTQQVFTASNYINYTYDNIGQLTSAKGLEGNGTTNRLHEQFGYGYDKAGNLLQKTNREFIESFQYTKANALTNIGFNGWLTVAGAASSQVTNISAIYAAAFIGYANGLVYFNPDPVYLYKDGTFAVYPDDHQAWYWTGSSYVYLDYPNYYTNNPVVTNYATVLYDLVFNTKQGTQTTSTNYLTPEYPGTYLYDQNGNLTNDILRSYGYDSENQLTNVTVAGSWRSDFIYDGLGRRRIERDYTWTNSAWSKTNEIRFVYDRNLLIQDRDANNHVLVTYTRGLDLGGGIQRAGGIGGLLARTDGNNNDSFYHADGSGNIMALMSGAQQTLVAQYLYNPFGQIEGQWGGQATANEMQFSSMPFHNLSGFSLYPFRAYNPNIQRWLNQDPIQERGGINLYRFVRNNPLSNFDPFGLQGFGNFGTGQVSQQNVDNPSTVQFNTGNAYVDNRPKNLFPNYSPIPPVQASNPNAFMGNTDDNSFLNAFGSLVFNPDAQDAVNDLINNNLLAQTAKICKNAKKPGPDDPFLQLLNLYGGFAGPAGSLVGDFAGKMSSNPNVDAMNKALDAAAEISLDKALSFPKEKGTDIMREEMYK